MRSRPPSIPYDTPRPLWSEQDPELWWDATVRAVGEALAQAGLRGDDVEAVGLTGQMHGLVALDAGDEVLRPAILWNDQRTGAECDLIRELVGRERLIADHRQRRAHRFHGAEDPLGPAHTSPRSGRRSPTCSCRRTSFACA